MHDAGSSLVGRVIGYGWLSDSPVLNRRQVGDRGIDQVPGDPGAFKQQTAAAVQCVGQRCRPQVLDQQQGCRHAQVEFRADKADVVGADQASDLGVTAAVLLVEDLWAAPLADALGRSGGLLLEGARIPRDLVDAAVADL